MLNTIICTHLDYHGNDGNKPDLRVRRESARIPWGQVTQIGEPEKRVRNRGSGGNISVEPLWVFPLAVKYHTGVHVFCRVYPERDRPSSEPLEKKMWDAEQECLTRWYYEQVWQAWDRGFAHALTLHQTLVGAPSMSIVPKPEANKGT